MALMNAVVLEKAVRNSLTFVKADNYKVERKSDLRKQTVCLSRTV